MITIILMSSSRVYFWGGGRRSQDNCHGFKNNEKTPSTGACFTCMDVLPLVQGSCGGCGGAGAGSAAPMPTAIAAAALRARAWVKLALLTSGPTRLCARDTVGRRL